MYIAIKMKKAIPNYPVSLKKHTNPFYSLNDISAFSQGFAYYHNREFPILMHSHNYYELNIIISGTCRHYVKNINHPAKYEDYSPKVEASDIIYPYNKTIDRCNEENHSLQYY